MLFKKYNNGKDFLGNINLAEALKPLAFLFKKILTIFAQSKERICDISNRDSLVIRSNTFTANLDKVSPSIQVLEFDTIAILDGGCYSLNSTTAATEITVKKNGVYMIDFYCSLDTTFDGEYIYGAISPKNKSANGFTGIGAYSLTGTASKGALIMTGIATLNKGDILRVITGSLSGSENGVKKTAGTGTLSITRIKPYRN